MKKHNVLCRTDVRKKGMCASAHIPFSVNCRALCPAEGQAGTDQHPQPLLPKPPQQKRSRMIQRQLSFPQPFPPNVFPPHPPQQQSSRMIHRQEDMPLPFSHPHPQFVAVKSLMLNPPISYCLQFYSMRERRMCERRRLFFLAVFNLLKDEPHPAFPIRPRLLEKERRIHGVLV